VTCWGSRHPLLRMSVRNPAKASNMARSTLRGLWLWLSMYSTWPLNLFASSIDSIIASKRSNATLHWVVKAAFPVNLFEAIFKGAGMMMNCLKTL